MVLEPDVYSGFHLIAMSSAPRDAADAKWIRRHVAIAKRAYSSSSPTIPPLTLALKQTRHRRLGYLPSYHEAPAPRWTQSQTARSQILHPGPDVLRWLFSEV